MILRFTKTREKFATGVMLPLNFSARWSTKQTQRKKERKKNEEEV